MSHTLLVLANPSDSQLAMLEELPEDTDVAAGDRPEAFMRAAPDADVILNWSPGGRELLREVLAMAPRVRWIHTRSAGLEQTLFPELIASPAVLTNGRGVFSRPLAEFVMGAALFFAKDFRRMLRAQAAGAWEPFDIAEIRGRTMGIAGYGDIGRAVAALARAMGMRVLAVRRQPELAAGDPLLDEALPPERLRDMLARSDYVVLAAPLTSQTAGMIGAAELSAMRPGAVLINVGRGGLVNEPALVDALEQRRILGAALDVFEQEPLPAGHAFYRLDNVLLSPHCADHTPDWLERAMRLFLDNFAQYRAGKPLRNVVDKTQGY